MNNEEFRREFQGDPLPNPSIESMADIIHWLWSHWMKYQINLKMTDTHHYETKQQTGMFTPIEFIDRWKRQMMLSYFDLPEDEKKSDRDLAKRIFGAHFVYDPFTGEEL